MNSDTCTAGEEVSLSLTSVRSSRPAYDGARGRLGSGGSAERDANLLGAPPGRAAEGGAAAVPVGTMGNHRPYRDRGGSRNKHLTGNVRNHVWADRSHLIAVFEALKLRCGGVDITGGCLARVNTPGHQVKALSIFCLCRCCTLALRRHPRPAIAASGSDATFFVITCGETPSKRQVH